VSTDVNTLLDAVREAWVFRLTPASKVILGSILFAGTASSLTLLTMPVYHIFCALISLYVVASLLAMIFRPKLTVRSHIGPKVSAGQPFVGTVELRNDSWKPAYDVSAGFFLLPDALQVPTAAATLPSLAPGASAKLTMEMLPLRRGMYTLPPLRAYSTFPFGIDRRGAGPHQVEPLLVLPSFHPLEKVDIPVGARYQPGGIALTSRVGESPEYIGNRDYRPGDPLRKVDFRSWARLAKPAVREYQEEYYCRIALVLDTYVGPRRRRPARGFEDLEAAVSMSAAVADALTRGEYIIDIFAAGPELYVFRAGRHLAHLDNVLEILACVSHCRHDPLETVTPALADELGNISTVVAVLLDWDHSRRNLLRTAAEAGCAIKTIICCNGNTTEPYHQAESWAGPITQLSPQAVADGGVRSL
jgi:uncharacterized protein (DUF58 family)